MQTIITFLTFLTVVVTAKNFEIGLEDLSCNFNEKLCSNSSCDVKLVPFKNGLINFGCRLKDFTTELDFTFSISYVNGLINQKIIDVNDNVCQYFRGKIQNPVIAGLMTALYYADPRQMHPCPYIGQIGVKNLDIDVLPKFLPGVFPSGKYVLNFSLRNQNDETIGNTKIEFQVQPTSECRKN